ncbi:calcium-binding protein [Sphingomonas colocasiae]|uniref:Calcium-binding protein n=1 Tax=Sphingomonas colocasiae TaxID=1848973 RepID=A0ABS7PWZ2_9SPHN|nr:calcium-binding protein [Sphingomonas colocasiae]MBY8825880.1 calcium-binding protein [Sphingomonas colocasiae]
MRKMIAVLAMLAATAGGQAQNAPPGGGRPGGGGPPGMGRPGMGQGPRMMKPIKRQAFDKAVTALFRSGDANRDGFVTLEELQSIVGARRDAIVRTRFETIDGNRDGAIDMNEFLAWQRRLGSLAAADDQRLIGSDSPVPEVIAPELGDDMDDRILARLIEPLGALMIVNANSNYDTGTSLQELLVYQGKRFDAVDTNGDGEISMEEARAADPRDGPARFGRPPGRPDQPTP